MIWYQRRNLVEVFIYRNTFEVPLLSSPYQSFMPPDYNEPPILAWHAFLKEHKGGPGAQGCFLEVEVWNLFACDQHLICGNEVQNVVV